MVQPARQYTYEDELLRAGVDLTDQTPDDIRELIADASSYVEALTDQIFNPVVDTARRWDGRGRRIAYDPQYIPIVAVTSVQIDYDKVNYSNSPLAMDLFQESSNWGEAILGIGMFGGQTVPATDYHVHPRFIEMIQARFPGGPGAVIVNGVFGWLDPAKTLVSTQLNMAGGLLSGAVSATVDDTTGFEIGDCILIGANLYAFVTSIPSGTVLGFNDVGSLPAAAYPDDTLVRTWGRVPRPISSLAAFFAAEFRREQQSREDAQAFIDLARIKKEQTDRYMYELFSPEKLSGTGGSLTGSVRHDIIVRRYSRPAMAQII